MSSIIFTGPEYPDDNVISCIDALKVNMTSRDYKGVRSNYNDTTPYIHNISIASGIMSCTVVFTNPITLEWFERKISSVSYSGLVCNALVNELSYSYGNKKFNISPCCVVATYSKKLEDTTTVQIDCKEPLLCTLENSNLHLSIADNNMMPVYEYPNGGPVNDQITGVNGIRTDMDNLTISGIGNVTVSVAAGSKKGK